LGIASSIGLGTGLHTFVLYLGPYIAKVSLFSQECGHLPLDTVDFGECNKNSSNTVSCLNLLFFVAF
jgi:hypothetical protein